ncbi:MAG: class I SAM-dependent methyltransferase [Candidatus Latescibacterota bacterium]|jgi:cyclopropane fatty-acyl-phospholipid synthase-like methyltransferase
MIAHDYMGHRNITSALRQSLSERSRPFSVLDLGCGDGSTTANALHGLPVRKYVGVDGSDAAIEQARVTFAAADFEVILITSDIRDYLARADGKVFDVIVVGFMAHHLQESEKPAFVDGCFRLLASGGDLFLYDVFRRDNEDRDEYLEAYADMIQTDWNGLSAKDKEGVIEHIREYDFPTTFEQMTGLALEAGFEVPRQAEYLDETRFHRLYRFKKSARL